jgi:kynurenine formamidase
VVTSALWRDVKEAPMLGSPSEDEVISYLERLNNAGRWGADDELGTLNLITPAVRLRALGEVREGITIGCARPIVIEPGATDVIEPPVHESVPTASPHQASPVMGTASDRIGVPSHGVTITHVDALSHFHVDGRTYGGRRTERRTAADPPAPGGIHAMRDGVVTRGVLVDAAAMRGCPWLEPGEGIGAEDLERWEAEHAVTLESGDALVLRTGWAARRDARGPYPERKHRPGLDASVLPWLHVREVAVVVSDAAHDRVPSALDRLAMPIHAVGLAAMGLCLVDNADLERLATACAARQRWTFLLLVAPLHVVNATGSPVTPVAVL